MLLTVETAYNLIEKEISKIKVSRNKNDLYEPINYMLGIGGKRLRPILTLFCYNIFRDDHVLIAKNSLAVEIFHNFTLMHDDIMDNAPLRRGNQTVHEMWNPNVAILSGDAMFVLAYSMFEKIDGELLNRVLYRFNQTALEVCEGQMLDMGFESDITIPSLDSYIEMIRLKTSVLLGFSMELGVILANIDDSISRVFYKIGELAGIGFQIKDDLLDLYGTTSKVGKVVGGDIISNKKTVLITKYFEVASNSDKNSSLTMLGNTNVDSAVKIGYFIKQFEKYSIKESCEDLMKSYFDEAICNLDQVKCDLFRKGKLKSLLLKLIDRDN